MDDLYDDPKAIREKMNFIIYSIFITIDSSLSAIEKCFINSILKYILKIFDHIFETILSQVTSMEYFKNTTMHLNMKKRLNIPRVTGNCDSNHI